MGLSTKQASSHEHVLDWNNLQTQNLEVKQPKQEIVISRRSQRQAQQFSEPLKCPRCESTNTKFCYYNNYNKSQPRHFCKTCKRHWTSGGMLRNVPVGGSRKSKRPKTQKEAIVDAAATTTTVNNAVINYQAADLDQDSISKSFKATNISNNMNLPNQGTLLFPFPSSSCFDQEQLFSIPATIPSISEAYYSNTVYSEAMDDSGFTTTMIPSSSSVGLDMTTSNWNWEDINTFVSSDLNTSLDDFIEINP